MASAEVALPRRPENISFVQSSVRAKEPPTNAFDRYFCPPSTMASEGRSGFTLPVVDLAGLSTGDAAAREEIVKQLGQAASEWGFFQIINHDISEARMGELQQLAREFFELPVDVKERGEDAIEMLYGYNGRFGHRRAETPWMEYLAHWFRPDSNVESVIEKIWPGGNPTFCNLVNEWSHSAEKLALQLTELLTESLGLKPDTLSKNFQDGVKTRAAWRLHHFPKCPYPSRCIGATAHSDTGIITILKQDEVGGLQVRKGDGFVDIKPVPGALVVNLGDSFESWSNGRFKSSEHRVLVNGQTDRYSIVYLLHGGPEDFVVQCPPELVDEEHPALYVPFTYLQFRANFERLARRGIVARKDSLAFALGKDTEGEDNCTP